MKKIPESVQAVLDEYIHLLDEHLPGAVTGLYIHGSIALDAYIEGASDIDFLTVTSRPLTKNDASVLAEIHASAAARYEKPELDGVYITAEEMGKLETKNGQEQNLYFNNGELQLGNYFNFNPVTWKLFAAGGISVLGPEPETYSIQNDPDQLLSYVRGNMNTYWADRIGRMKDSIKEIIHMPEEEIDEEIEWTVLGLLRQFFTLREQDITSKLGAGEYGLKHLPQEWHPVIHEAVSLRQGEKNREFRSKQNRIEAALDFSDHLIQLCRREFFELNKLWGQKD